MFKKRVIPTLIAIAILATFVISTAVATGSSKIHELGSFAKNLYKEKEVKLAIIDGENITEQELKAKKMFTQAQGKKINNQEAFDMVIKDKILIIEAKKHGLFPNDMETKAYIKDIRSTYEDAKAKGLIDKESEKQHKDFLAGLGMTEEEYWQHQATVESYRYGLAIAKLRSELANEWGFTIEKFNSPEGIAEFEDRLDNMVKSFKGKKKVEILKEISSIVG